MSKTTKSICELCEVRFCSEDELFCDSCFSMVYDSVDNSTNDSKEEDLPDEFLSGYEEEVNYNKDGYWGDDS